MWSVLMFCWCSPRLKDHMQYCVNHPEEISKLSKVKAHLSEVKGIMMDNIEKVYPQLNVYCPERYNAACISFFTSKCQTWVLHKRRFLTLLFCMLIISLFYLNDIFRDNMILFSIIYFLLYFSNQLVETICFWSLSIVWPSHRPAAS